MRRWLGQRSRKQVTERPSTRIERPGYTLSVFGDTRDRSDEGAYVEVRLPGGHGWCATLYTPEGVRAILDEWRRVGGENAGLYFWAPGVILIRELGSLERIVALVEDLMVENELELAFVPLEHDRRTPQRAPPEKRVPKSTGPKYRAFEPQIGSYPQYVVDEW